MTSQPSKCTGAANYVLQVVFSIAFFGTAGQKDYGTPDSLKTVLNFYRDTTITIPRLKYFRNQRDACVKEYAANNRFQVVLTHG